MYATILNIIVSVVSVICGAGLFRLWIEYRRAKYNLNVALRNTINSIVNEHRHVKTAIYEDYLEHKRLADRLIPFPFCARRRFLNVWRKYEQYYRELKECQSTQILGFLAATDRSDFQVVDVYLRPLQSITECGTFAI